MEATFDSGLYYIGWTRDFWRRTINKVTIYDMETGEILFESKENKDENNILE